jgi:hypothetical protein
MVVVPVVYTLFDDFAGLFRRRKPEDRQVVEQQRLVEAEPKASN